MELWRRVLETKLKSMSDLELARFMDDIIDCHECPFVKRCDEDKSIYCHDFWLEDLHKEVE